MRRCFKLQGLLRAAAVGEHIIVLPVHTLATTSPDASASSETTWRGAVGGYSSYTQFTTNSRSNSSSSGSSSSTTNHALPQRLQSSSSALLLHRRAHSQPVQRSVFSPKKLLEPSDSSTTRSLSGRSSVTSSAKANATLRQQQQLVLHSQQNAATAIQVRCHALTCSIHIA